MKTLEWWVTFLVWLGGIALVRGIVALTVKIWNSTSPGYVSGWVLVLIVLAALVLIGLVGGACWIAAAAFPGEAQEV